MNMRNLSETLLLPLHTASGSTSASELKDVLNGDYQYGI